MKFNSKLLAIILFACMALGAVNESKGFVDYAEDVVAFDQQEINDVFVAASFNVEAVSFEAVEFMKYNDDALGLPGGVVDFDVDKSQLKNCDVINLHTVTRSKGNPIRGSPV